MCQYTRIVWNNCGHVKLSSTPEHTLLCTTDFHLRQGIDRAPASCHLLPDDIDDVDRNSVSDKVAQMNYLFAFCDDCKDDAKAASNVQAIATPIVPEVEEFGEYSDDDAVEIARLRDLLWSNNNKVELAARKFEILLTTRPETTTATIENIHNQTIRNLLLTPGKAKYFDFFSKSHQEVCELLKVLELYKNIRVPEGIFSALYALARNKLYQADARRVIFCQLVENLANYGPETRAYGAAINYAADQLAFRLGRPVVPDADAFAHLQTESPLHVRDAFAAKESVRRRSVKGHASVITTPYAPRSSFGRGRNKNALTADTDIASNPPPGTRDMPPLRRIGETLEVVYVEGLETRMSLVPLGVGRGPWGIANVLGRHEDVEETLRGSPERQERGIESPRERNQTLSEDAMFMGKTLPDTDGEVSANDDGDMEDKADERDANREDLLLRTEDKIWQRDNNGRMVKKRKCSA